MTSKTSKDSFVSVRSLYGLNVLRGGVVLLILFSSLYSVIEQNQNALVKPTSEQWAFSFSNSLIASQEALGTNKSFRISSDVNLDTKVKVAPSKEELANVSLTSESEDVSSLTRHELVPVALMSGASLGNSLHNNESQSSVPKKVKMADATINPIYHMSNQLLKNSKRKHNFLIGVGGYYELGNLNTLLIPVYSNLSGFEELISEPLNSSQTHVNNALALTVGNQFQYNERWSMLVGLNYYQMQLSQMIYLRNRVTFNNKVLVASGARANSNSQTYIVNRQSHTYFVDTVFSQVTAQSIEIPLAINYNFVRTSKYTLGVNLGVQAALYTNYKGVLVSNYIPKELFTHPNNIFNAVSAICGVAATYRLNNGLGIFNRAQELLAEEAIS